MQTITIVPSHMLEALLWIGIVATILVAAHILSALFGNPYTGEED